MKILSNSRFPYVLGLDIGATSIGWCVIRTRDGKPLALERAGVRCFEAGVEGNIEMGKDASRAATRRDKRLARRQAWRRARRQKKLFIALQRRGLLPAGPSCTAEERHALLLALDLQLRAIEFNDGCDGEVAAHLLPYRLRAAALRMPLDAHAVGRAIYHLAQRRGYQSNRKSEKKQEDESGIVEPAIAKLKETIGVKTLGEHFASLDPKLQRIRRRWLPRSGVQDEFERIWNAQAAFASAAARRLHYTHDSKNELRSAIFFQRSIKSQKGLVGRCELELRAKRSPIALPIAQEFRILQAVNHLKVNGPRAASRPLTLAERSAILGWLSHEGEIKFAALRKRLKLTGTKFNLEEGGEERIIGDRTSAKLATIFGARWNQMATDEQEGIVYELLSFQKRDPLIRRAMATWSLAREQAETLADVRLEPAYARHSRRALRRLVLLMREGLSYSEARKEAYPASFQTRGVVEMLPPVYKAFNDLRNPAVARALTELRKVVNSLVRRYGKPETVRIELARDLKRSRKERQRRSDLAMKHRRRREEALLRILQEFPDYQPRRGFDAGVEKVLLADECNWECPYTGRPINMQSLLGKNPQFDVEHIYPRRYLDDSFLNKTICYHEENRNHKRGLLPFAAYAHSAERWGEILQRVRRFQGISGRVKLERFLSEAVPDDFTSSQLNDTRHNSTLAAEYVAMLFGGRVDSDGRLRVQTLAGGITAHLRNEWRLNSVARGAAKDRSDHRHHAIDAIVIALTDPSAVHLLERAAEEASRLGLRRMYAPIEPPWPNFIDDALRLYGGIIVSHRANHKLGGSLHAESLYSEINSGGDARTFHLRKELIKLTTTEIEGEQIVDPVVRKAVQEKFAHLGGGKPNVVFADSANHPHLVARDGRHVPIHKVRIRAKEKARPIGTGFGRRFVAAGAGTNHHAQIVAELRPDGSEKAWKDICVARLDAVKRVRQNRENDRPNALEEDLGPTRRLKFSLMPNDSLVMNDDLGKEQIYRVVSISQGDIELRLHCDARDQATLKAQKARIRATGDLLRKREARKVVVSPVGDVREVGSQHKRDAK